MNDRDGLRPTGERVRETVFDWLTHLTGGLSGAVVLDMFSGSGAMGLEAASRGASKVYCIEKDRRSAGAIRSVVEKLKAEKEVEVVCADAFAFVGRTSEKFDLVFIDPPFAAKWQLTAAKSVIPVLSENAIVYIEDEKEIAEEELAGVGLASIRRGRAGAVWYLLAEKIAADAVS